MEERILILAVRGRDAQVTEQVLRVAGQDCFVCENIDDLAGELARGGGAALITEESLTDGDRKGLQVWLEHQPAWSDFPFILLATKRHGRRPKEAVDMLHHLGNVVVLERPIHADTLASAAASALRGRRRQYEARERMQELTSAENRLMTLNGTLEDRIGRRTVELARANNQLMQEIAERARTQAALVQSQKMEAVGQLTGGIAHDFNNLLTVIGGNLEMIRRRATDPRVDSLADMAMQASTRAAKLTRQLLAFSRSQRLTLSPVDINTLILGMDDLLDRTIGPLHGVEKVLDPTDPWTMADANQVELAILNLLINGRDAMSGGGLLTVSTRTASAAAGLAQGQYVVVAVTDRGTGIPAAHLDKVFDPFFTTKPIGKGTGLGLSQVYGIAQQSGGAARIESIEGEGATVEIWLPLTAQPAEVDVVDVAPSLGPTETPVRVLLVEDDEGVRRFIADCLEMLGYAVVVASHGREGLERLGDAIPELMIIDYAMPGLNGVEVAEAARALAPNLPIILATGYADMEVVHKVFDAAHILRKPFQINDLSLAVQRALAEVV